jgi:hypothetical protein
VRFSGQPLTSAGENRVQQPIIHFLGEEPSSADVMIRFENIHYALLKRYAVSEEFLVCSWLRV